MWIKTWKALFYNDIEMATKCDKICQVTYCGRDGVKTEGCCLISIRVALAQQSANAAEAAEMGVCATGRAVEWYSHFGEWEGLQKVTNRTETSSINLLYSW